MGKHAGAQKRGVVASYQLHEPFFWGSKMFQRNSEPVSEVSAGNCRACSEKPFPSASLMKSEQHVPLAEIYCWQ